MANVVYSDPFGAYTSGREAGTRNAIQTGEAARNFRNNDLNYDFMKWYQPIRQEEAKLALTGHQAEVYPHVFKNASDVGAYTGNYGPLNNAVGQAYNIDPNTFPHMNGVDSQRNADTAFGREPAGFAYPDVWEAGGQLRNVNGVKGQQFGNNGQQSPLQQLQEQAQTLQLQHYIQQMQGGGAGAQGGMPSIPHLNPLFGIPSQQPQSTGGVNAQPQLNGQRTNQNMPFDIFAPTDTNAPKQTEQSGDEFNSSDYNLGEQ